MTLTAQVKKLKPQNLGPMYVLRGSFPLPKANLMGSVVKGG